MGLKYYDEDNAAASKALSYEKVREFIFRFEKQHSSASCLDLIGVDISTEEGLIRARDQSLFETKCSEYVRGASKLLAGFL